MAKSRSVVKVIVSVALVLVVVSLILFGVGLSQGGSNPESPGDGNNGGETPSPVTPPTSAPTNGDLATQAPVSAPPATDAPTEAPITVDPTGCVINEQISIGVNDYISVIFPVCPSDAAFEAFTSAARRWSAIIDQTSRPAANIGGFVSPNSLCSFISSTVPVFQQNEVVDRLVIFAETTPIDGPGGTLAAAGPCQLDNSGKIILGGMFFDTDDLSELEADGTLEDVILHEMGHVLGIGTFWNELLQDRTFLADGSINTNANPTFVGVSGTAEYSSLTGETEVGVPVEDGRNANGVFFFDVANGEGQGSVDGHWKITDFINELMVFQIDPSVAHPLSRVSLASLEDLGYTVDLSLADDFQLPSLNQKHNKNKKNIRGENHVHELTGDVINLFHSTDDIKKRTLKPPQE